MGMWYGKTKIVGCLMHYKYDSHRTGGVGAHLTLVRAEAGRLRTDDIEI